VESNGVKTSVSVNLGETVMDAKKKFVEGKQYSPESIELKYGVKELTNDLTIENAFMGQAGGTVTVQAVIKS
jgi:hypothetical protein